MLTSPTSAGEETTKEQTTWVRYLKKMSVGVFDFFLFYDRRSWASPRFICWLWLCEKRMNWTVHNVSRLCILCYSYVMRNPSTIMKSSYRWWWWWWCIPNYLVVSPIQHTWCLIIYLLCLLRHLFFLRSLKKRIFAKNINTINTNIYLEGPVV